MTLREYAIEANRLAEAERVSLERRLIGRLWRS